MRRTRGSGKSTKERFDIKWTVDHKTGCWLWLGTCNSLGYGRFTVYTRDKGWRAYPASRASWFIHRGPIPKNLCVCHICDNPSCVNPSHLFLGTHDENMKDAVKKGRIPRGTNRPNAMLSPEKVKFIRKSSLKQKNLAQIFRVDPSLISRVRRREKWTWI